MNKYIINETLNKTRLDKAINILNEKISRSYAATLLEQGHILVNGKIEKPSYKLKTNDEVIIDIPEIKPLEIKSEDIPLDIVYEDEDILIINKPQGMVVHPSNGHNEHTLVNAILHHCKNLSGINGVARPGIVHRIDKDTSGLICVAKNDAAHEYLSSQLFDHSMNREYIALVRGVIKENNGQIDLPIGRDKNDRKKMGVNQENGKEAITNFKVIERYKEHTLIRCSLLTGRTHQIRVHMAYIGYPVEGDPLYGGRKYDKYYLNGQLLVAVTLRLRHPKSHEMMEFNIDLPSYFKEVIDQVKSL